MITLFNNQQKSQTYFNKSKQKLGRCNTHFTFRHNMHELKQKIPKFHLSKSVTISIIRCVIAWDTLNATISTRIS